MKTCANISASIQPIPAAAMMCSFTVGLSLDKGRDTRSKVSR
jgi:hypothetical protein